MTRGLPPFRSTVRSALAGTLLLVLVAWPAGGVDPFDPAGTPMPVDRAPLTAQADPTASPDAGPDDPVPVDPVPVDPSAPVVSLTLDRVDAANGDQVIASVTVTNPGPESLLLRCARPISVWADISGAVEGPRAAWSVSDPWRRGIRRQLLGDPLTGSGPLAVAFSPIERRPACTGPTTEVPAGGMLTGGFRWSVGYPDGSPLYGPNEGPVTVRARVVPVRTRAQANAGEDATTPGAAGQQLVVASARIRRTLSPAWAIEALFEEPEAARWLDLEHGGTWRRSDLRLVRGGWRVEVRRVATGCCREALSATIDTQTGRVTQLDAPRLAWTPARTVVSTFENVELRIELQRILFRDGRTTRLRVTARKLRGGGPVWYWSWDNACLAQPSMWIAAGSEKVGLRWPGVLGRFKRRALKGELIIASAGPPSHHVCRAPEPVRLLRRQPVTMESFYRPALVPTGQRTLQAVGRIDLIGRTPDAVRPWRVYASPTVRARFRTGDGSAQMLSPGMLIDAALSNGDFAARVRSTPRSRWRAAGVTGTSVWLELKDGTRIVGLP